MSMHAPRDQQLDAAIRLLQHQAADLKAIRGHMVWLVAIALLVLALAVLQLIASA